MTAATLFSKQDPLLRSQAVGTEIRHTPRQLASYLFLSGGSLTPFSLEPVAVGAHDSVGHIVAKAGSQGAHIRIHMTARRPTEARRIRHHTHTPVVAADHVLVVAKYGLATDQDTRGQIRGQEYDWYQANGEVVANPSVPSPPEATLQSVALIWTSDAAFDL